MLRGCSSSSSLDLVQRERKKKFNASRRRGASHLQRVEFVCSEQQQQQQSVCYSVCLFAQCIQFAGTGECEVPRTSHSKQLQPATLHPLLLLLLNERVVPLLSNRIRSEQSVLLLLLLLLLPSRASKTGERELFGGSWPIISSGTLGHRLIGTSCAHSVRSAACTDRNEKRERENSFNGGDRCPLFEPREQSEE